MNLQQAITITIVTFFLVASLVAFVIWSQFAFANRQAGVSMVKKVVSIPLGQSFNKISKQLLAKGIISHEIMFKIHANLTGQDKKIKAGEYLLSPFMTPVQVLDIITNGKVRLYKIVIPEGYNLKQIAIVVGNSKLVSEIDFLTRVYDKNFLHKMGINADSLEGYLFPETYHFPKGIKVEKIISTMIRNYKTVFNEKWRNRAKELNFTEHQIVTLASIIEKETADTSERFLISSVFHNRLKKKMRLETDPTVIYGIKNFDGNITRKHLKTLTPYNTYLISGLPPGPIANPGKKSIEAALYPASTKYFFFVSKNNKTHKFSINFKEHNRAVKKYQLR